MNEQAEFWTSDFGNEYTSRNRVDWRARIPFWDGIIQRYGIRSVFELGTNAGWNFSAIKHSVNGYNVGLQGVEINEQARRQASSAGHKSIVDGNFPDDFMMLPAHELTYTSGVLIHIPPEKLKEVMCGLIDVSCQYIMAIEYESEQEEEVEYRGHTERLWKRPYGQLYQDLGLKLVETGNAEGFDSCTYWLLEK